MRTYSHAVLTYAAARWIPRKLNRNSALTAAIGAATPDTPMALGAAWLWTKRKTFSHKTFDTEVCGRTRFRAPDSALHSAPVVAAAMLVERSIRGKNSAFTLGWAGHVLTDFLTHGKDARPILWPLSNWKFESPVSYRENERHGRAFTIIEHAAIIATIALLASK